MRFETPEEVEAYLEQAGIRFHKLAVVDVDGVLRGKYVDKSKFASALRSGFGFCNVVLGWDSADQLYDNTNLVGWHTGYRDAPVRLDLSTVRRLPLEADTILVLGQFVGAYARACPRSLLERVIQRATAAGLTAHAAFEYEFFVIEAALSYRPALDAADRAALVKTYTKVLLQRAGLMATFMAKWSSDYPGQSGHLHISLTDRDDKNVFFSPDGDGLSETFRHFVAGQALLLPDVLAMVCSTVNAYRRLVPGLWAPTHATWGIENRTTAIRAIPAGAKGTRSEYRIGPADGNPYLVLAAALATGLYGIEQRLELPPVEGNAYEHPGAGARELPTTLGAATRAFLESKLTRELFGDTFVEHFAQTRIWEDRAAQ